LEHIDNIIIKNYNLFELYPCTLTREDAEMVATSEQKQYAKAAALSYKGQEQSFSLPIGRIAIASQELGFQPSGIQSFGSLIAIADYFGPAVLLAEASVDGGTLNLRKIRWIRGTIAGKESVRMFPDINPSSGVNRIQTAVIYSGSELGLIRNGERKIFRVVYRDGKWCHKGETCFPKDDKNYMMHSAALCDDGRLLTIESGGDLKDWRLYEYKDGHRLLGSDRLASYRYGIAIRKRDRAIFTIGDFRAKQKGIFINNALRVPDIAGNGIVLLNDGMDGALVVRYGGGHPGPFNGIPGALLHVPSSLIS
jgi:hypothetical protein